ncbi:hypothetical protein [Streptomyces clavifer]|uniref:hypothetical protein n=1 Tax=Streptomyces clavifer TaxID=68188 RepID=UPI0033F6A0F2
MTEARRLVAQVAKTQFALGDKALEIEPMRPVGRSVALTEREAQRPVGAEVLRRALGRGHRGPGTRSVCGPCCADDVARQEADAEAACIEAAAPPEPEDEPEPGRGRGWFRRRV